VPQPRKTEPTSYHAKNDDGQSFLGNDLVKQADGSYRSKTPAEQRRDAEAASEKIRAASVKPSRHVDEWETIAKTYIGSGGSHGRNASLREIYDRAFRGELEWREAASQMSALKKSYSALLPTARY